VQTLTKPGWVRERQTHTHSHTLFRLTHMYVLTWAHVKSRPRLHINKYIHILYININIYTVTFKHRYIGVHGRSYTETVNTIFDILLDTYTCKHTHTHTHSLAHAHAHAHAHTHTLAHTHTHSHTH